MTISIEEESHEPSLVSLPTARTLQLWNDLDGTTPARRTAEKAAERIVMAVRNEDMIEFVF